MSEIELNNFDKFYEKVPQKIEIINNVMPNINGQNKLNIILLNNKNNNKCGSCLIGLIMGLIFNIFGLFCICLVDNMLWYFIGCIFPCSLFLIVIILFMIIL